MSEWITTREASRLVGYHAEHIRKLVRSGKVKAQKFGEVWQVHRADLLAYVRAAERLGEKRGPKPTVDA